MSDLGRYCSVIQDSARWEGFPFRADDIVISTPPKSGTTWMQLLCAMLVFDGFEFGRPLTGISPWLDMETANLAEEIASSEAQEHRRFGSPNWSPMTSRHGRTRVGRASAQHHSSWARVPG